MRKGCTIEAGEASTPSRRDFPRKAGGPARFGTRERGPAARNWGIGERETGGSDTGAQWAAAVKNNAPVASAPFRSTDARPVRVKAEIFERNAY